MKQRCIPRETIELEGEEVSRILSYFNKIADVPMDAKLFYIYPCDDLQPVDRVIIALKDKMFWSLTLWQLVNIGYGVSEGGLK